MEAIELSRTPQSVGKIGHDYLIWVSPEADTETRI